MSFGRFATRARSSQLAVVQELTPRTTQTPRCSNRCHNTVRVKIMLKKDPLTLVAILIFIQEGVKFPRISTWTNPFLTKAWSRLAMSKNECRTIKPRNKILVIWRSMSKSAGLGRSLNKLGRQRLRRSLPRTLRRMLGNARIVNK